MEKKRRNIFTKYFLVISSIILTGFAVLGMGLLASMSNYWGEEKTQTLSDNTAAISRTTADLISTGRFNMDLEGSILLLRNTLALVSNAIDADVFLCDEQGKIVACQDISLQSLYDGQQLNCVHTGYQVSGSALELAAQQGEFRGKSKLGLYEKNSYASVRPVTVNGVIRAYVVATAQTSLGRTYLLDIFKMFAISSLLALLLAFAGVYVMTYSIVKPLREMSKATRCYAQGDFTYRVQAEGNDEMSELAGAFNSMAKALGVLESSRRSFVANVSHELKTPMTTIGGFIDGILDGTIPPEKESYYLTIVSNEVKRLSRLVMSMLNMSKIEAGELKLKPKRFDISACIFKVFVAFEQSIDKKHIEIEGLDQMSSVYLEADEDMIHQVVYNLVDNAVKFTQEGGCISVSAIADQEKVIVRIRNTGEGISPEEISRIFERFYKVDKSRSIDVKGAGLGLYIVRSIIELHGGQITAGSQEGKYCEFVFWLPVHYGESF